MFANFVNLPKELKDLVISFTKNNVFDLCLTNKYFNENCKVIRITNNNKYPKLRDNNLKVLINLTSLNLINNNNITDKGIKGLINFTSLDLFDNNIITDEGIKGLINLTSLNLTNNVIITDEGIKRLINLIYLNLN